MMDYYELGVRLSYQDSLKILEADVQQANMLAASIPRGKSGFGLHIKLVYNHFAPILMFLLQWMDCSCTCLLSSYLNLFHVVVYKVGFFLLAFVCSDGRPDISSFGRKATIREFYTVILPYLQRLYSDSSELEVAKEEGPGFEMVVRKRLEDTKKLSDMDLEREDECGICLELCTKVVLPSCCHAMCINCYRDWYIRLHSFLHIDFTTWSLLISSYRVIKLQLFVFSQYVTGAQDQNLARFAEEV
ncbi:hypothetical protein EZV62_023866 [Acer yangbiense]|uniref:RING-type domain-containing protein n=1 Tax=Acer yangbiense TaxID=1000413 RepID=A0A5C7H4J1_9ROSI|nr:hypothetical protein EZV62_023866 [Acer yangbiense]